MKTKFNKLLEAFTDKTINTNNTEMLIQLCKCYLLTGNPSKGLQMADTTIASNQNTEDDDYLKDDLYFRVAKQAILLSDESTFYQAIRHLKTNNHGVILSGVYDLKLKKYDAAFQKLSQLNTHDYEFSGQVSDLIELALPQSIADFPIEKILNNLSHDSLKQQIFTIFFKLACEKPTPEDEHKVYAVIEKCSDPCEQDGYRTNYKTLLLAHQGKYEEAITHAEKTCDLREVGLLDQIVEIMVSDNKIKLANSTTLLTVEKAEAINWDAYCQGDQLFADSQRGIFIVERLISLCKLYYSTEQTLDEAQIFNKILNIVKHMPTEEHYGEYVLTQYSLLIDLSLDLKKTELLKNIVGLCSTLALQMDNMTNIYLAILGAINKYTELLDDGFLTWVQQTVKIKNLNEEQAIQVNIAWVKIFITNSEVEKALVLADSIVRNKKAEHYALLEVAPLHFELANTKEIEDLFMMIGDEKSSTYLMGVATKLHPKQTSQI